MAEKKEQQALPEEKLLKVIQGGGRGGGSPASSGPRAAAVTSETASKEPSASVPPTAVREKPALKVASAAPKPEPKSPPPAKPPTSSSKGSNPQKIGRALPVSAARRHPGGGSALLLMNRLLGVSAGILLLLAAWEITSAFQGGTVVPAQPVSIPDAEPATVPTDGTNVGAVVTDVSFKIFDSVPENPGSTPTDLPPQVEWQVYARDNLNLIGRSGETNDPVREAILFDRKTNKMLVVKIGEKITLVQRELTIDQINVDEVVLTDGRQKFPLK